MNMRGTIQTAVLGLQGLGHDTGCAAYQLETMRRIP